MTLESVVIWPEKPEWDRSELIDSLRRVLRGRVEQAWLIGSYADGTAHGGSDIDLILVRSTALSWPERGRDFSDLRDHYGEVDLLIYTPGEWPGQIGNPSAFLENAARSWIKLI